MTHRKPLIAVASLFIATLAQARIAPSSTDQARAEAAASEVLLGAAFPEAPLALTRTDDARALAGRAPSAAPEERGRSVECVPTTTDEARHLGLGHYRPVLTVAHVETCDRD